MCLTEYFNFNALFTRNSFLVYALLVSLGLLIQFFKRYPNLILLIALLLSILVILLRNDSLNYKFKLVTAMTLFGLYGIVSESLVIRNTGILKYSYPSKRLGLNFPLWLFFIYTSWLLLIEILFKFTKIIS